jgi:hypothetical protein
VRWTIRQNRNRRASAAMEGLPRMAAINQLAMECPHCRTERAAFSIGGAMQILQTPQTIVMLQCRVCGKGIVAEVNTNTYHVWLQGAVPMEGQILSHYPRARPHTAPRDTPPEVGSAYLSGLRNLERADGSDINAAVAMFRRSLEIAVRRLDPEAPQRTPLDKRIERLSSDLITPAMKLWAHEVRLGGNDALHDPEEFTEAEAAKLRDFAELFLTYAFTLPVMLQQAKKPPKA